MDAVRMPVPATPVAAVSCPICIEPYNGTRRKRVPCEHCSTPCCRACLQGSAIASGDASSGCHPRCVFPECRRSFTVGFVAEELGRTFLGTALRDAEEARLLTEARSRLPELQPLASAYREVSELANATPERRLAAQRDHAALVRQIVDMNQSLAEKRWELDMMRPASSSNRLISRARILHARRRRAAHSSAAPPTSGGAEAGPSSAARPTAPFRCPRGDCRGFATRNLSLGAFTGGSSREQSLAADSRLHQCGMCGAEACPDCERLVEATAEGARAPHVCAVEDALSVKAVRESTRACPWCSVAVQKSFGCDQMFCTACNRPFDYRTGARITRLERFENPHYSAQLRTGAAPLLGPEPAALLLRDLERASRIRDPPGGRTDVGEDPLNKERRATFHVLALTIASVHARDPEDARIGRPRLAIEEIEEPLCELLCGAIDEAGAGRQLYLLDRGRRFQAEQAAAVRHARDDAEARIGRWERERFGQALRTRLLFAGSEEASAAAAGIVLELFGELELLREDSNAALRRIASAFERANCLQFDVVWQAGAWSDPARKKAKKPA